MNSKNLHIVNKLNIFLPDSAFKADAKTFWYGVLLTLVCVAGIITARN